MIENTIYSQEDKLWLTVAVLWIFVFEVLLVVRAFPIPVKIDCEYFF